MFYSMASKSVNKIQWRFSGLPRHWTEVFITLPSGKVKRGYYSYESWMWYLSDGSLVDDVQCWAEIPFEDAIT